jgi:hypothetical protein
MLGPYEATFGRDEIAEELGEAPGEECAADREKVRTPARPPTRV